MKPSETAKPARVVRGEVWLVELDPTLGSEIQKTRPCLIVSPPELHDHLRTVLVAPMTTASRSAPWRVPIHFGGRDGLLLLDQIRAIDKQRLIRRLGRSTDQPLHQTLDCLRQVFAH